MLLGPVIMLLLQSFGYGGRRSRRKTLPPKALLKMLSWDSIFTRVSAAEPEFPG